MENERKSSKGMIIIIAILSFAVLGLVSYICINNGILSSKEKETNTQNSMNYNEEEEKKENTEKETNEESNTTTIKELDLSKCINTTEVKYKNESTKAENDGLAMKIADSKNEVILSINWEVFGSMSKATAWANETKDYKVIGFEKNVQDVMVGELGQSAEGLTLFFLMEDGTVEYTPMFIKQTDSQNNIYYKMNYYDNKDMFKTSGKVPNVSSIVKLYNVDAYNQAGWRTTIGATADGSFYDLGHEINK